MTKSNNQPDWHAIAEKFDIWLPQLKPVGDAMLDILQVNHGDLVLDVASGTGEPALSLAKLQRDVVITGVDSAEGMINVAQSKVEKQKLKNISFQTMPVEHLAFDDNSFDKILCRFGVMLFEDPQAGLNEMFRVLKPNGQFVLAVWGEAETMPSMYWSYQIFKDKVDEQAYPPLHKVTWLGEDGVFETLLNNAGFENITIEHKTFNYQFDSIDDYWDALESSDILKQQFEAMENSSKSEVRNELAEFAKEYVTAEGLRVPHDYLLVHGKK